MSSLSHVGKGVMRVAKNYTKGYSDVQAKVRDATSNDKWGPSGTQMNELAQLTYNQNDFIEIMEMLDKRLNDKGKNWRHVFKSLTVLDYLLHAGSENVVLYFKDNIYIIKTLKEFQYIDEEGKDQGANVRQKAKDITNLLQDASRLQQERRNRASMRDRMTRAGTLDGEFDDENTRRRSQSLPPRRKETDADLQRAIEESKRSLALEQAKGKEDRDLQEAIRLSEEEEAKRRKAIADASGSLFDDHSQNANGNGNNPFPLIDMSAPVQPQYTIQPQFTSFNPYQQQMQQEAIQAEYLRQQAEWQQQQLQLQAQQQAQLQAAQQQEEWMRQQQMLALQQQQQQQQQQFLLAQPTGFGSNNPFAPSTSPNLSLSTSNASSFSSNNSLTASPAPQSAGPSFNLQGTYANGGPSTNLSSSPATSPPPPSYSAPPTQGTLNVKTRNDEQHAHLANLFANRDDDGIDTFGNFGQLRYGQQAGRVVTQPTGQQSGHNPFHQQQQQQTSDQPFFSI